MVDYGLITKNDDGGTQIDSTFQNFTLQEQKSATINISHDVYHYHVAETIPIIPSTIPPLVAIRTFSNRLIALLGYTMQENIYNGIKVTSGPWYNSWNYQTPKPATQFDYIVGRGITSTPSGGYGLSVWASDGRICFHSDYKYLKILSSHSFELPTPNPYTGNYPYVDIYHPNIYNPYYILTPNWAGLGTAEYTGGPPPNHFAAIVQMTVGLRSLSSESVRIQSFEFGGFWRRGYPIPPIFWNGPFTLLTCTV